MTKKPTFGQSLGKFALPCTLFLIFGIVGGFAIDELYLERLSSDQVAFVDGVVSGAIFRREFNIWKAESGNESDVRSDPERRCAAAYYPANPIAMSGCLEAINGRPADGYNIP